MRANSVFHYLILAAIVSSVFGEGQIQMRVDVNFDGVIAFPDHAPPRTPMDETSAEQPFLIWWNSDQDDKTYYETAPVTKPDGEDSVINSLRDMEDLMRLHIRLDEPGKQLFQREDTILRLHWLDHDGAPSLRFFMSAYPDGSLDYLDDEAEVLKQFAEPFKTATRFLYRTQCTST